LSQNQNYTLPECFARCSPVMATSALPSHSSSGKLKSATN